MTGADRIDELERRVTELAQRQAEFGDTVNAGLAAPLERLGGHVDRRPALRVVEGGGEVVTEPEPVRLYAVQ